MSNQLQFLYLISHPITHLIFFRIIIRLNGDVSLGTVSLYLRSINVRMERSHYWSVCSAKKILASEEYMHTIRDPGKQDEKQPAQLHAADFWQTFNSFCCFSRKNIYLCNVIRSRGGGKEEGREREFYRQPTSQHVTIQRMSRKTNLLYRLRDCTPPKDICREENCLWKGEKTT